ncbi:MAG: lipoyl(octanoyl) transferase LipB [Candidatus Marinimicrobia bacterium]|jgi:lipoate-protein ligase B|nr:lipoyl(octanoyl) transferase LipB [Candidatus Neomarinimicrobiota bacterium]MBT3618713.1 lipoyl(octanoyl) transferase LipB [Candidatus Neomarinimicrobiota bacterium]MBT3828280.1 lipoyl(octanoyl) transferase LipB [Candidatus Neomarinimicrobiota bacterium]MBT3997259.1 lipoyl(octanoyl) transferase LipB [Candidatus Neomarinimicrobiota bacterium]MBT4280143.1 lipoyl(octanoyl) transferase LipB [Candidatus Neomarinimicrobiota bacterium]
MSIKIQDLGKMDYNSAWNLQKALQKRVMAGKGEDTLLLVEHEPVYTFGKNADENHLLEHMSHDVKVFHIERGGDITFHGPGQLVGYPILDLNLYCKSITWYMRSLESVIIQTLESFGIKADVKEGLTGVWVNDEKIAALGVRISRWVTMHGFSLNVNTDLSYYDDIIPCGIFEYGVTSINKVMNCSVEIEDVKAVIIKEFNRIIIPKKCWN